MGLFDWLFGKNKSRYTQKTIDIVSFSAQRYVDIINESLQIANTSHNVDTKLSRLWVAKSKLYELEKLANKYDFLHLTELDKVKASIQELDFEFLNANLQGIASANLEAEKLEKEGKINEALRIYEKLANEGTDTPFTYRRLVILYRRQKRRSEELETIKLALANIPPSNTKHYEWFEERLSKIKQKA